MKGHHTLRLFKLIQLLISAALILLLAACSSAPKVAPSATETPMQPPVVDEVDQEELESIDEADRWRWVEGTSSWRYLGAETPPEVAPEAWGFGEGAISLNVTASDQLNAVDGKPHTLVLRFLQLNSRRDFQSVRKTRSGIRDLLLADDIEQIGAGVVALEELVVRPGESITRVMDRLAETRYLAIVAGYYALDGEASTRLIPFPALDDTVEPEFSLVDTMTYGLFAEDIEQLPRRPGLLLIDLGLGSKEIGSVAIDTR